MISRLPRPLRLPALGAAALWLLGCSLSTPSPWTALQHDPTPRTLPAGHMETRLAFSGDYSPTLLSIDHLHLAQSYGWSEDRSVSALVDGGFLRLMDSGQAIEDEGLYLGLAVKNKVRSRDAERYPATWQYGLGWGTFGDFVDYVDGFFGASRGTGGEHFTVFGNLTGGLSVPYRRTYFEADVGNVLADLGGINERGIFRFATSLWASSALGAEYRFGNGRDGARLWASAGVDQAIALEEERVRLKSGNQDTSQLPYSFTTNFRLGVSYTY